MRWDPGLPKTAVPGSRLLIAAYFKVWLYQGGPGSAPRSTGHAAHSRHSRLALTSSAAGCLVPGQTSHSTSHGSRTVHWPGTEVPGHLAPPAVVSRSQ